MGSGKHDIVCRDLLFSWRTMHSEPSWTTLWLRSSILIFHLFITQTWYVGGGYVYIHIYVLFSMHICIILLSWQAHFKTQLSQPKWVSWFKYVIMPHLFLAKCRGHIGMISPHWASSESSIRHLHCNVILKEEIPNLSNHFWCHIRRHEVDLISFPSISVF